MKRQRKLLERSNLSVKLVPDFRKKIAEALGMTEKWIDEYFDIAEDKQGYFVAKLKPKCFLDKAQFRTMCALVRDLGGESYLQGMKAWRVPGPFAKASRSTSQDARSKPALQPAGVTPHVVRKDKAPSPYVVSVPVDALLTMPFQCRSVAEDAEIAELADNIKAYGVLQPILVRPKPNGLYEVVAGGRRLTAAKRAGLVEIPVNIRFLSDDEAFVIQLTENLQRKDLSDYEKSRALTSLAQRTKWTAQQIADKLKMSYRWVVKYLPDEFKVAEKAEAGKLGGEATAEAYRESQDFGARRAPESQDMRQGVPCASCGVVTSVPVHLGDKYYCDSCAESAAKPKLEPPHNAVPAREDVHWTPAPETKPEPKPLLTGYEWTCPECGKKHLINHVDYEGSNVVDHVLEACGE